MTEEIRELFFPFNAYEILNKDGIYEPDRVYDAEDFAAYWAQIVTTGVCPTPSNALKVESLADNMVVTVRPGSALINGYGHILRDDMPVRISDADPVYMRRDTIVLRLDLTERWVRVVYREGAAGASTQAPELIRTDDIYELQLAEITVKSGAVRITQADILDTRLDNTVCGLMWIAPLHIDTTELFNQYQSYLDQQIAAWNAREVQADKDWRAQMDRQAAEFAASQSEVEMWYDSVKNDITKLQTFDFDNLAALKGVTRTSVKGADGNWMEEIKVTQTGLRVAVRQTAKQAEGWIGIVTVYDRNGSDILRTSTVTTQKMRTGAGRKPCPAVSRDLHLTCPRA